MHVGPMMPQLTVHGKIAGYISAQPDHAVAPPAFGFGFSLKEKPQEQTSAGLESSAAVPVPAAEEPIKQKGRKKQKADQKQRCSLLVLLARMS